MYDVIQKELPDIKTHQIKATLDLLNDGNTVPFVARYRKEMTGSLDEVQIRAIWDKAQYFEKLTHRKEEVIKNIAEQDKLTNDLKQKIENADTMQIVEDLYLPYKQKRRTKATIAKENGLQPLADQVRTLQDRSLNSAIDAYLSANPDSEFQTHDEVIEGITAILSESISDNAKYREFIRDYTKRNAELVVKLKPKAADLDENQVYQQYYDFSESIKKIAGYKILAINRGEKEKILSVSIKLDTDGIYQYLRFHLVGHHENESAQIMTSAYEEAYKKSIKPSIDREIRNELSESASQHAIEVFGDNLYHLLMQTPMKGKIVLGFDPAYRTGCKLAIIDENGKFLDKLVIYPHKPAPENKRKQAKQQFIDFLNRYDVQMIAIGNGTASRESEEFVSDALHEIDRPLQYVIVNEAGASVYSASQNARDEFPDLHVEERSAVSIARRLQDPLAELIKIDPQSVGVGQYQHDVPEKELSEQLDHVVEDAVNQVGVNLNTASPELLVHISGLNKTIANNIVNYRNENGRYLSRKDLKKVPRLGPKAFEQSVGFLRIIEGKNPLDNTDIHPESYPAAKDILTLVDETPDQVGTPELNEKLSHLDLKKLASETETGTETLTDILNGLKTPGRDLRDEMSAPLLRSDVMTMADLKTGMKLQGTVRNVVDFGAFVDIGVKHDGLVHISKLSDHFVKDPARIVSVGDIVTVWIDSVDENRNRIQLTMIDPEKA